MDIKEKRKQYYIDNRDSILQRNKQYYLGSPASAHWSIRDFEPSLRPGIIGKRKKMKKKVIHLF